MTLNDDMTATAAGGGATSSGTWLAFYDQAFKVDLDNGMRFITNFRYSVKEFVASNPIETGEKGLGEL